MGERQPTNKTETRDSLFWVKMSTCQSQEPPWKDKGLGARLMFDLKMSTKIADWKCGNVSTITKIQRL